MIKNDEAATRIGKYSSMTAGVCTALFGVFLALGFFVETIMLQFAVCLLLAISYVVAANCLCSVANSEVRIWGRIAVSFAVIYAVYICLVYYSQLTVINLGLVPADSLKLIRFVPGNWLFAVDMLGYTFLALSTLAASFLINKKGLERKIKVFLIIHGALAIPTFIFPMLPLFNTSESVENASLGGIFALLAWCVVFAPICFMLVKYFSLKNVGSAEEKGLS